MSRSRCSRMPAISSLSHNVSTMYFIYGQIKLRVKKKKKLHVHKNICLYSRRSSFFLQKHKLYQTFRVGDSTRRLVDRVRNGFKCINASCSVWRKRQPIVALQTTAWNSGHHGLVLLKCSVLQICAYLLQKMSIIIENGTPHTRSNFTQIHHLQHCTTAMSYYH